MSALKITADRVAALAAAVSPLDTPDRRDRYRALDFPRSWSVVNLDKRYRWDLVWDAGFPVHDLYATQPDVTDAHIDSALRSIVSPL